MRCSSRSSSCRPIGGVIAQSVAGLLSCLTTGPGEWFPVSPSFLQIVMQGALDVGKPAEFPREHDCDPVVGP